MELKDIGEFGLIARFGRGCVVRPEGVVKSIGDDAAGFMPPAGEVMLVTTDLLVERIHFLRERTDAAALGYKSLAVNLSDIAAMGGTAREAFVSIAIPPDCTVDYLDGFYDGMKDLAKKYAVNLLGGDTTRSRRDLIINVCVVGSVPRGEMLGRDRAETGDVIFSTGVLGDSRAGLFLLDDPPEAVTGGDRLLIDAHLLPEPHLAEGRFLARRKGVNAAIDVSDGLSADLGHILEQSGKGAVLYGERIPVSPAMKEFCGNRNIDPVDFALAGGEDYTLLVTVGASSAGTVAEAFQRRFHRPLHAIGRITEDIGMWLEESGGGRKRISSTGWDHFRSR